MEILRNGRKPEEIVLYGQCVCGCEFVAEEGEYIIKNTVDGAIYISKCPCCNRGIGLEHKTKTFTDSRKPNYWRDN